MKRIRIIIIFFTIASCGISKRDYRINSKEHVPKNYLRQSMGQVFDNSKIKQKWWSEFKDPVLDTLIKKARRHNLDINTAIANMYASRAYLKKIKFDRYPTVTANASYTRTRLGENVFLQGSNPIYNTYQSSFDALWETNLFGRVTNRTQMAYANYQQSLADMQGVYVSVFAEVANNYMKLKGLQYLLDITKRNLLTQQETYNLTSKLLQTGHSNKLDAIRAQAQLENTRANIPLLKAGMEAIKNSISVLVGEVPGELNLEMVNKKTLPNLPSSVSLGNVQELIRRRPDIYRAEAKLKTHIAKYNLSVSELYPTIQFGGSIGFSAVDFATFGSKQSTTWTIMPKISWSAFNMGRVKQQIKQNDALTIAALNEYKRVVLQGLEEIRTTIDTYAKELQRREILRVSFEANVEADSLAKKRYTAGLDSFIDYLSSNGKLLETEYQLAESEISTITSLIAVYKALGGGWEIITENELHKKFEEMKLNEINSK